MITLAFILVSTKKESGSYHDLVTKCFQMFANYHITPHNTNYISLLQI